MSIAVKSNGNVWMRSGGGMWALPVSNGILSWDAVSNAIGYTVYWGTEPSSFHAGTLADPYYANSQDVGNVLSVSAATLGLSAGTYYMAVRAQDIVGLGDYSAEATVTV